MPDLALALQKLRKAGYRITNARQVVLSVLGEEGEHLNSAQILERVENRDPAIGRASVFRTLELLTALSIIRPTYLEARSPVYVLMSPAGHHAHIICTSCQQVFELDDCHVDDLIVGLETRHSVLITGHLLEFYGLCRECSAPVAASVARDRTGNP
jgi:Fe2+ or Zn2+ uptake regulation protein